MKDLLAAQKASTFGQVSDNESSITESDCETLVASSDEETSCKHVVDKKNLITVRIRQGRVLVQYLSRQLICKYSHNYKCLANA